MFHRQILFDLLKRKIPIVFITGRGETGLDDLKKDIDFLISLDVPHISTYSLIIEDNTKLKINGVKNIDK